MSKKGTFCGILYLQIKHSHVQTYVNPEIQNHSLDQPVLNERTETHAQHKWRNKCISLLFYPRKLEQWDTRDFPDKPRRRKLTGKISTITELQAILSEKCI